VAKAGLNVNQVPYLNLDNGEMQVLAVGNAPLDRGTSW
jgi:hypothetical protein